MTAKGVLGSLVFPVVALVAFAVMMQGGRGASATPEGFDDALPLHEALARASAEGRTVVAVATASWCGPCQAYKKTALADERVRALLSDRAVAILIDVDARPEEARLLGVSSIPATVVLDGSGQELSRLSGNVPASKLLRALESLPGGR